MPAAHRTATTMAHKGPWRRSLHGHRVHNADRRPHVVPVNLARYSNRGLLEHVAEQNAQILDNQEKQLALEQAEQEALDAASGALTKLGTDIGIVLVAKDKQVNTLTVQLSDALAKLGASAQQIADFQAQIAAQTAASNAAATQITSAFTTIAQTITSLDATVVADTPHEADAPPVEIPTTPDPVVPVVTDPVPVTPDTPAIPDTPTSDPTATPEPVFTGEPVVPPVATVPVGETPAEGVPAESDPAITPLA